MKYFLDVINIKSIIVVTAACACTVMCMKFDFVFDVPIELIGIAIVFPIVFSINAASARREKHLNHYSVLKGCAYAIRLTHMHWTNIQND